MRDQLLQFTHGLLARDRSNLRKSSKGIFVSHFIAVFRFQTSTLKNGTRVWVRQCCANTACDVRSAFYMAFLYMVSRSQDAFLRCSFLCTYLAPSALHPVIKWYSLCIAFEPADSSGAFCESVWYFLLRPPLYLFVSPNWHILWVLTSLSVMYTKSGFRQSAQGNPSGLFFCFSFILMSVASSEVRSPLLSHTPYHSYATLSIHVASTPFKTISFIHASDSVIFN